MNLKFTGGERLKFSLKGTSTSLKLQRTIYLYLAAMSENVLLYQHPNTSCIESFSIKNLFGSKDIFIPFDQESLILIAENGSGKTTILNILYYLMSSNFSKLKSLEFESAILKFKNKEQGCVEIKKSDLENNSLLDGVEERVEEVIAGYFPTYNIERTLIKELRIIFERRMPSSAMQQQLRRCFKNHSMHLSDSVVERITDQLIYQRMFFKRANKNNFAEMRKIIDVNLKEQILYFPTYRRIEEELINLGYSEGSFDYLEKSDEKLIQFGMDDVAKRFNRVKVDIKNSIVDSFSKFSGEMLTQLVEGIAITSEMKESIKPDVLKIVLGRVGDKNISTSDKQRIESLVTTGELFGEKYDQLIYFLSKLINVYEQQQDKDESIKKFVEVCNRYLNNKQIVYNETTVDISITETKTGNPIRITNLSSGEKQIISIFSKMYLDYSTDFILLFDEPELSLSIEWQKMLLPDILNSRKCKFLLAVTHSPFIFDNELDPNARDLDNFVVET
jgi:ABC-type lipoprotein export system ATPase subunit